MWTRSSGSRVALRKGAEGGGITPSACVARNLTTGSTPLLYHGSGLSVSVLSLRQRCDPPRRVLRYRPRRCRIPCP
jgi:hypothetical protein